MDHVELCGVKILVGCKITIVQRFSYRSSHTACDILENQILYNTGKEEKELSFRDI